MVNGHFKVSFSCLFVQVNFDTKFTLKPRSAEDSYAGISSTLSKKKLNFLQFFCTHEQFKIAKLNEAVETAISSQ